jgi:hypothetical protein
VPDGAASEATDALRVFKGLVVLKLMKSDARVSCLRPALGGRPPRTIKDAVQATDSPSPPPLVQPAYVGGRCDLMIGSLGAAYNRPVLDCYGVTHVLTVGSNIRPKFEDAFRYMIVPGECQNKWGTPPHPRRLTSRMNVCVCPVCAAVV